MPTQPKRVSYTNNAPEVLNYVRQNATVNYKNAVPYATPDGEVLKEIGGVLLHLHF